MTGRDPFCEGVDGVWGWRLRVLVDWVEKAVTLESNEGMLLPLQCENGWWVQDH